MDAQHAQELRAARERFELQHGQEQLTQETRRDHQASLAAIEFESQKQLLQQTENFEVARISKVQKLERDHRARQQQQELQHAKQVSDQRLIAEEKAELLASQGLERRLALETQHAVERAVKVQKLEKEELAARHKMELAHAKQVSDQRLIADERAEKLASQALQRRMALETKHNAELAKMRLDYVEHAASRSRGQNQIEWDVD